MVKGNIEQLKVKLFYGRCIFSRIALYSSASSELSQVRYE